MWPHGRKPGAAVSPSGVSSQGFCWVAFIRASSYSRLVILCQSIVGAGQPRSV